MRIRRTLTIEDYQQQADRVWDQVFKELPNVSTEKLVSAMGECNRIAIAVLLKESKERESKLKALGVYDDWKSRISN